MIGQMVTLGWGGGGGGIMKETFHTEHQMNFSQVSSQASRFLVQAALVLSRGVLLVCSLSSGIGRSLPFNCQLLR